MLVPDLESQQMPADVFEVFGREVMEHDDQLYERRVALVVFLSRQRAKKAAPLQVVTRVLVQKASQWDLHTGFLWDAAPAFAIASAIEARQTAPAAASGVKSLDALTVASAAWVELEKRFAQVNKDRWMVAHHVRIADRKELRTIIKEMKRQTGGWGIQCSLDVPDDAIAHWCAALRRLQAAAPP